MTIPSDEIKKYLEISSNGGGDYHPTQQKICFVSDRSGVNQVFTCDLTTGETKRISQGDNRSTNPVYLPDGSIAYSTDFGGNERFQIMIYNEEKGEHYRLTSFLEAKHQFQFATDNAIYLSANLLDNQRFDVFRYTFPLSEGQQEELLLQGEPFIPIRPALVNKEETVLVAAKIKGNLSNDLLLYDLNTKEVVEVTSKNFAGHNDRFYPIEFLSDTTLLVRSDYSRDFLSLSILDLGSGELTYIEDDNWDTGRVMVNLENSPVEVMFSKNIDGSHVLYHAQLTDMELLNLEVLPMPSEFGILSSGDFRSYTRSFVLNEEKNKLLLTFSSPTEITNLFEIDIASKEVKPVLESIEFDGVPFIGYTLHRFNSFDDLEVPYFLMTPEGDGPFPTIFQIHGGPEAQSTAGFSNRLQLLASQGYMIVIPNIRGSNGYGRKYLALDDVEKRLDSIKDINALAGHLVATNPKVDENKLIVYGGSYGGFAVLSSITEFPERFNVAIDIVGISNFVTFLENTAEWRRRLREVEYGFLDKHREFLEQISPSNKVDQIITPTLIIQGDNDERVPLSESIQMYEKLKENGIATKLLRFEDEGHGVVKRKNLIVQYQTVFEFLEEYLAEDLSF